MFPCGSTLFIYFPIKNVQNITEIDVFYANFSEKGCLHITISANFSKRENGWIVQTRGETHLSTAFISNGNLPVSQTSHHLSKSNNLDMFALEANMLFLLLFRSCSNIDLNRDRPNPGTSKPPHMPNRI